MARSRPHGADLHAHTTWSDGRASPGALASTAQTLGYA
jgi:predicted metal-dependent phosphoesterase TrpH